jgi:Family of unknown function (DUF6282)
MLDHGHSKLRDQSSAGRELPFAQLLHGAIDSHVHCAPHINARTVTVFDAVREAASAGLAGLGIMDVFANTSGLAALAMRELGHLGVDVFGGIILEPYVGGIDSRVVGNALKMGYGPGTGARFVSMPCHHTHFVAVSERRPADYVASCFYWAENEPLSDALKAILDQIAEADVVFNTGHVTGVETVRLVDAARSRGVERILCPASYFSLDEATQAAAAGAFLEFSFFVLSHATAVGQTMIDGERHRFPLVSLDSVAEKIRAAGAEKCILSSDSGSYVLPPPVEAFRELIVMVESVGFSDKDIRQMIAVNTAHLFRKPEAKS